MTQPTARKLRLSPEKLMALLFGGIALAMFTAAVLSGVYVAAQHAREVRVPGAVTALITRTDADGNAITYPAVTFRLSDGAYYTTEIAEGGSPSTYTVDQPITVIYDPEHPERAWIASSFSLPALWILPAITAFLGIAFLLAARLAWWLDNQFS